MFQRFARIIVILAAVQLLGGHWVALQSAAWLRMAVSYSRSDSVVNALEKTFDGEHPCSLCKVVKKGRSEEQKEQNAKLIVKFEAVLANTFCVAESGYEEQAFALSDERTPVRAHTPPTPPPLLG